MFLILIWYPRHLNNECIYMPVVVKIHIIDQYTVARLLVLRTAMTHVYNHWAYKYTHGTLRFNKETPKCLPLNFAKL